MMLMRSEKSRASNRGMTARALMAASISTAPISTTATEPQVEQLQPARERLRSPAAGIEAKAPTAQSIGMGAQAPNIRKPRSSPAGTSATSGQSPYADAHFATFPPELAERCIKAGTSAKGCCPTCAAPWARTITKGEPDEAHRAASGADSTGGYNGQSTKDHDSHGVQNASDVKRRILEGMRLKTYGWQPTCDCPLADPVPCTVLDPFAGAFTTALVADRLGRDAIGIELNADYIAMAKRRIEQDAGLFAQFAAD